MRTLHFYPGLLFALLLMACSPIDESQRLIEIEPLTSQRVVLLEDFTGQRCVNCPEANELTHQMLQEYGADHLIAVAIHSAPLGILPNPRVVGLRTPLGDAYAQHWGVESQPTGLVNRRGGLRTRFEWRALVHQELQRSTPLRLSLARLTSQQQGQPRLQVVLKSSEPLQGKLQLWVVEDQIQAPQMLPQGLEPRYLHQHVLRAAVNGTWGTPIALQAQQAQTLDFDVPLDAAWQRAHLRIVAFVYNEQGVLQAVAAPLE